MPQNKYWKRLLDRVQVEGQLRPVSDMRLDAFESNRRVKLPKSYREFCNIFGPGSLRGQLWIHIAVPEDASVDADANLAVQQSIDVLNREIWPTVFLDLDEYCSNPQLIRSGLFFAKDIYTNHYFWNLNEVTNGEVNECAIYVIFRGMKIHRLADTFESFVRDICLDKGIPNHGKAEEDPPLFEAAPQL